MTEDTKTGGTRIWIIVVAVVAGVVFAACAAIGRWGGLDFYIDPTQLMGKLSPLLLAAAFIERAVEVLISPWRDTEAAKKQAVLDHAKAATPPDPDKIASASRDLNEYRGTTQQYAFAAALLLSAAVSAVGVRALWPLLKTPSLDGIGEEQKIAYYLFDITISAVMLAGGASGIHSVVTAFTSFFDSAGEKARQSVAPQSESATPS